MQRVNRWNRLDDRLGLKGGGEVLTANYGSRAISDNDANQPYISGGLNKTLEVE